MTNESAAKQPCSFSTESVNNRHDNNYLIHPKINIGQTSYWTSVIISVFATILSYIVNFVKCCFSDLEYILIKTFLVLKLSTCSAIQSRISRFAQVANSAAVRHTVVKSSIKFENIDFFSKQHVLLTIFSKSYRYCC